VGEGEGERGDDDRPPPATGLAHLLRLRTFPHRGLRAGSSRDLRARSHPRETCRPRTLPPPLRKNSFLSSLKFGRVEKTANANAPRVNFMPQLKRSSSSSYLLYLDASFTSLTPVESSSFYHLLVPFVSELSLSDFPYYTILQERLASTWGSGPEENNALRRDPRPSLTLN
jgi:hypothetical protein